MAVGVAFEGTEKLTRKRVFYEGTDTLYDGYALCYNADYATTALPVTSFNDGRAWRVEKPAAANVHRFAGIVAPGQSGKVGPCVVEIVQPTFAGTSCKAYCSANCVINSTLLCLVIDSYILGANGPVIVGQAAQTVDRSSTSGVVQIILTGPRILRADGQEVGVSTNFNDVIWKNFPLADLRLQPHLGTLVEYDPQFSPRAALPPWAVYAGAHNTVALEPSTAFGTTGGIVLAHNASVADNDAAAIQIPGGVVVSGGKPWAFEVVASVGSVTNADSEYLIGLCKAVTLSNTVPFADGGVVAATLDGVFFDIKSDDGDSMDVSYVETGETAVVHDAGVIVPVAATLFRAAMYYDGTDINVYAAATNIDGTDTADPILAADIADLTDNFPAGDTVHLTFAIKGDSGVADGDDMKVHAFRLCQLA